MTLSDSLAIALARLAYDQQRNLYFSDVLDPVPPKSLFGTPRKLTETWHLMMMVEREANGGNNA